MRKLSSVFALAVGGLAVGALVGSRGALGVLVQASLKLLPQPPSRAAMIWACDAAALADAERWRDWPRREPAVLTVLGRAVAAPNPVLNCDGPFTVVAGFEEDAAWVEDCAEWPRRTRDNSTWRRWSSARTRTRRSRARSSPR